MRALQFLTCDQQNNMLQSLAPKQSKTSQFRKENSSPFSANRAPYSHHILNLDITQSIDSQSKSYYHKSIDANFKTFYNTASLSWRAKRHHRNERLPVTPDRHTIVGTPFASADLEEKDSGAAFFPLVDREHYRYLVNAISGIKRGRQLSEIKRWQNPQSNLFQLYNQAANRYPLYSMSPTADAPLASNHKKAELCASPKVVNIEGQLKSRKQNRNSGDRKDNSFQNIFKNKRRLRIKYYDSDRGEQGSAFDVSFMGEQELKIHQIEWSKTCRVRNHA